MSDPSIKIRSSSEKRRASGKWPLWGLVVLLAGGAAWCGGTDQGAQFAAQTKDKIMSFLGKPSEPPTVPAIELAAEPSGRIKQESGPHVVAAAISSSDQPADPETERNALIDKAVQDARQWSEQHSAAGNDVASGASSEGQKALGGDPKNTGSGSASPSSGTEAEKDVVHTTGESQAAASSGVGDISGNPEGSEKADVQPEAVNTSEQNGKDSGTGLQPGLDSTGSESDISGVSSVQAGESDVSGNSGIKTQDTGTVKAESPSAEGVSKDNSQNSSKEVQSTSGGGGESFSPKQTKPSHGAAMPSAQNVQDSHARIEGSTASGRIHRNAKAAGGSFVQGKISLDSSSAGGQHGSIHLDGSYGGRLEDAAAPDEERADPVVTRDYVADTARWLASCYVPSSRSGSRGYTTATLERINERGGSSTLLRSHERDPLKNRQSVLQHVFTPGMVQSLGQMYAPRFLDEMENAAASRGNGTLNRGQIADMFRVYSRRFQQVSVSLLAAADADVAPLAAAIQKHAVGESEANAAFSRAYTAQTRAREAGDSEGARAYSQRMVESSRQASQHAAAQDRARRELSARIMSRTLGEPLPEQELSFLGQWLARRNASPDTVRAAANLCRYLSEKCAERADAIVNVGGTD